LDIGSRNWRVRGGGVGEQGWFRRDESAEGWKPPAETGGSRLETGSSDRQPDYGLLEINFCNVGAYPCGRPEGQAQGRAPSDYRNVSQQGRTLAVAPLGQAQGRASSDYRNVYQ
jgi:hypothetical protein